MISIQEQDCELTMTDYLSLKYSPSCLLCTGISNEFLGVNRHLSLRLHKSCSVSIVDSTCVFTFLMLLNQIWSLLLQCTLAWLGEWWAQLRCSSKVLHLCSLVCPVGSSTSPPRQAPNSLSTVSYRFRRPLYQSEVHCWSKRYMLLCMKDSHSLLKVYFFLLPNEGNYLVLLLTDSKQLLGFRLGHILSFWKY